jgi:hypothetical protein
MQPDSNPSTEQLQKPVEAAPEAACVVPDWFSRFASEIRSGLSSIHRRVTDLESVGNAVQPVEQVVEATIGALAPNARPVIDQVNEIQSFLGDLLGAFHVHFGGNKMNLPPAPTGQK